MGASQPRVLGLVLVDGLKLALPGLAVGSVLAFVLSQQALVVVYDYFGRTALVGGVMVFAATTVLAVVLLASAVPARRATAILPMSALGHE